MLPSTPTRIRGSRYTRRRPCLARAAGRSSAEQAWARRPGRRSLRSSIRAGRSREKEVSTGQPKLCHRFMRYLRRTSTRFHLPSHVPPAPRPAADHPAALPSSTTWSAVRSRSPSNWPNRQSENRREDRCTCARPSASLERPTFSPAVPADSKIRHCRKARRRQSVVPTALRGAAWGRWIGCK